MSIVSRSTLRYAAYGSNLHPERLCERVPSAALLGAAEVPGRTLRFHKRSDDGSAKCSIDASDGAIHVAVYEIDSAHKRLLDGFEGLGVGYRIESLDVSDFGACFTYVATDTHIDESLKPFDWYRELVIVGCEFLGFPQRYIDNIAAVESVEDPDFERHRKHMAIVYRARAQVGRRFAEQR